MKVLVVEDDTETLSLVGDGLRVAGHEVALASEGRAGLLAAASGDWDVLVIDRMLPGLDGLGLLRTLRASGVATPALFLTTLGGIDDRVTGLNAGADDYLVKPFALAELAARVAALGRRPSRPSPETMLRVADLTLDLLTQKVARGDRPIELQPREFALLRFLMRNAGRAVTRTMLLEQVWNFHFDPKTNLVDSHVSRLRAKIDDGGRPLIRTIRGAGYMIGDDA